MMIYLEDTQEPYFGMYQPLGLDKSDKKQPRLRLSLDYTASAVKQFLIRTTKLGGAFPKMKARKGLLFSWVYNPRVNGWNPKGWWFGSTFFLLFLLGYFQVPS